MEKLNHLRNPEGKNRKGFTLFQSLNSLGRQVLSLIRMRIHPFDSDRYRNIVEHPINRTTELAIATKPPASKKIIRPLAPDIITYPELPIIPFEEQIGKVDSGKKDTRSADHAVVTITNKTSSEEFIIDTQSAEGVALGRLLMALRDSKEDHFYSSNISDATWQTMTIGERLLFTTELEEAINNQPSEALEQAVLNILTQLTHKLLLTKVIRGNKPGLFKRFSAADSLTVEYHNQTYTPYSETYRNRRPIISPNQLDLSELEPQQLNNLKSKVINYLATVDGNREIDEPTAIEMLDFIMSHTGKAIIRLVLGEQQDTRSFYDVRQVFHDFLRRRFKSYYIALENRQIGGTRRHSGGRTPRQIGGELPADKTKWGLGRTAEERRRGLYVSGHKGEGDKA